MNVFPKTAKFIDTAFVGCAIILPPLQATAQARLEDRILEGELELGTVRVDLLFILQKDFLEQIGSENSLLIGVKDTHDARHINPLLVGFE